MQTFGIILLVSGIVIIVYPQIIAYILGGLLIFFGLNILFARFLLSKNKKDSKDYVSFGKYKIYRE